METLGYIKGRNKLSKVHYSFAPLNTHSDTKALRLQFWCFLALSLTWASECQQPLGRHLSLCFRCSNGRKARVNTGILGREIVVDAQRRFGSTDRNIWRPPWGTIQNIVPPARTRKIKKMRNTRQGSVVPNGRKPHPATGYGNDAGPSRRSGCVKSKPRTHLGWFGYVAGNKRRTAPIEWGIAQVSAKSRRRTRGGRSRTCDTAKGVPDAVLARDHGFCDTSHVRRAQSYLH